MSTETLSPPLATHPSELSSSSRTSSAGSLPLYDKTVISQACHPKPKRIIICCDGTWQSSTSLNPEQGNPSNVARLCRVLAQAGTGPVSQDTSAGGGGDEKNRVFEWQQVIYYDAGVGTGDITGFEKKRQGKSCHYRPPSFGMSQELTAMRIL